MSLYISTSPFCDGGSKRLRESTPVTGRVWPRSAWTRSSWRRVGDWIVFLRRAVHPLGTAEVPVKHVHSEHYWKSVASLVQFHFLSSFRTYSWLFRQNSGAVGKQSWLGFFASTKCVLRSNGFASIHRQKLSQAFIDIPRHVLWNAISVILLR